MTRRVSSFCPKEQAFAPKGEQRYFGTWRNRFTSGFFHNHSVNAGSIRAEKCVAEPGPGDMENSITAYFCSQKPRKFDRKLSHYHGYFPDEWAQSEATLRIEVRVTLQ